MRRFSSAFLSSTFFSGFLPSTPRIVRWTSFIRSRQVDPGRTRRFAGLAVEAVLDDGPSVSPSVIEIGQYEPYSADVNMAVVMAAHKFVDGANICACAAANTPERPRENRVFCQGEPSVIEKNDVHLLPAHRVPACIPSTR